MSDNYTSKESSLAVLVIKKLLTALIVTILLLFTSNIAWLVAWCQYDYSTIEVTQDSENSGDCNYIGEEGDIIYGETDCKEDYTN